MCLYCRIVLVFKHVKANLRSIRRVSGIERKTDPASSARSSRESLHVNNNRLLDIVNKFCISFGTEIEITICGGLDCDCTVVNHHRVANFNIQIKISTIIWISNEPNGYNIIFITIYTACNNTLYRFSVKNTANRPVFRVKLVIF